MKVTRTGMTTVIAQAYAAYKRSGPVEETKAAMAGGMVMGDQTAGNWLASGQNGKQKPAPSPALTEPTSKTSLSTSTLSLPRKGGTDILV
jgi:hypothetical protein